MAQERLGSQYRQWDTAARQIAAPGPTLARTDDAAVGVATGSAAGSALGVRLGERLGDSHGVA